MSLDLLLTIGIVVLIAAIIFFISFGDDYSDGALKIISTCLLVTIYIIGILVFANTYNGIDFKDGETISQGVIVRYERDEIFVRPDNEGKYIKLKLNMLNYSNRVPKGRFVEKKFYVGPIYKTKYFISE